MQLKGITDIDSPKIGICCRMAEIQMEDTKRNTDSDLSDEC